MTRPGLRAGPVTTLVALTAGAVAGLVAAGRALPAPPGTPGRWYGWWQATGPVTAVFSLARLVLLGLLVLWTGALVAAAALAATRDGRLPSWSGPPTRPVLRLALLLSASGAPLAACGSAPHSPAAGPPAPVLYNLARPAAPSGTPAPRPPGPGRAPTPTPAQAAARPARAAPAAPPTRRAVPVRTAPPATSAPAAVPAGPRPGQPWVVQPGDDLWTIAARAIDSLPAAGDRPPVAPYWLKVIQANRHRLPDPADPSLLFPGDTVVLPAL